MGPGHYVCIRQEWGLDIMYVSSRNGAWTLCMYVITAVSLDRIIEVREGQRSEWFEMFPYEALEAQSFSILYEESSMFIAYVYNNV